MVKSQFWGPPGVMSKWLQLYIGGYNQVITVLHSGGMPKWLQYYIGGQGSLGTPKSDYLICARPLKSIHKLIQTQIQNVDPTLASKSGPKYSLKTRINLSLKILTKIHLEPRTNFSHILEITKVDIEQPSTYARVTSVKSEQHWCVSEWHRLTKTGLGFDNKE